MNRRQKRKIKIYANVSAGQAKDALVPLLLQASKNDAIRALKRVYGSRNQPMKKHKTR